MTFVIRPATPADARGYIALIRGVLREQPPVDTPYAPDEFMPPLERISSRIAEVAESDNSLFLVVEADRKIVGTLTCGGGTLKADHHMTALGMYVIKDWRDQGIGNGLMAYCIEWAQVSPVVERVELEVYAHNARAIHLYEKYGFEREGVKRRLYYQNGQPIDMLIMARLWEKNHHKKSIGAYGCAESPPPWSLTAALIAVLVAFVAVIVGTGVALVWFEGHSFATLGGWLLGGIITILFIRQTRDLKTLRLQASEQPILFVMFICFGIAIGFDILSLAVTHQFLPKSEFLGLNLSAVDALDWIFAGLFMVLVQPIAEELVFRGLLFSSLRATFGAWPGLIGSALIYAVFHLLAYPPDYVNAESLTPIWYGLLLPFLDGLVFSAVRAYTQSTRAAIAGHAAFGIFAVVKLLTLLG